MHPVETQGFGPEPTFDGLRHQPMTYALVLVAEACRFRSSPTLEGRRRIGAAFAWLVDNADLDGDGAPGWGLPDAWDAFGDGSLNPTNHPYTITTALAAEALLDALELEVDAGGEALLSGAQREQAADLLTATWLRWSRHWTDDGRVAYFWYSPSPHDAHYVPNVSSMWVGVGARLLAQPWVVRNARLARAVRAKVARGSASLVEEAELVDGAPFWRYLVGQGRPNDALHQAYTLWGLERVRHSAVGLVIPWSRRQSLASVQAYVGTDGIHEYPHADPGRDRDDHASAPARLWGAGALLAVVARYGGDQLARRLLLMIDGRYGPFPDLRLYPDGTDATYYPRHGAHVLWGIAEHAYRPRVGS